MSVLYIYHFDVYGGHFTKWQPFQWVMLFIAATKAKRNATTILIYSRLYILKLLNWEKLLRFAQSRWAHMLGVFFVWKWKTCPWVLSYCSETLRCRLQFSMDCTYSWLPWKLQKIFVKVAGGQENWFSQVLQHLGKHTRFWKITHHPNKTSPIGDSLCLAPPPLTNTHQEHVKTTDSNTEPASQRANRRVHSSKGNLKLWCSGSSPYSCFCDLFGLVTSHCTFCNQSLTKLVHWFFTFYHYQYVRWISFHLRDVTTLSHLHPYM